MTGLSLRTTARQALPLFALTFALACGDDSSTEDTTGAASTGSDPTGTMPATDDGTAGADSSTSADPTTGADSSTGAGVCEDERPAIVTDIDETLTTSDDEFFMQIGDGNYDPAEREGGAAMITAYADLGYRILYLTARNEEIMIKVTNETGREATQRWLEEHGYPVDPETTELVLAPMFVVGDDAQEYKAQALMDRQAMGLRFDYAYGNATSDIGAYAEAGIPLENTFIIGENAGKSGTVAIAEEDWLAHSEAHLPTVPAVCEAADG
ncbi:MAG: hypothetical protein AAF799_09310 [Myxococcota bacterium]